MRGGDWDTTIQSKDHMKILGEDGVYKLRREASEEAKRADTLISAFQTPELETVKFCVLSHSVCGMYYGSPSKRHQKPSRWVSIKTPKRPQVIKTIRWKQYSDLVGTRPGVECWLYHLQAESPWEGRFTSAAWCPRGSTEHCTSWRQVVKVR